VPTTAVGTEVVVIASVAGAIVRVRLAAAISEGEPESVTLMDRAEALAGAVGVPLIRPVNAFSDSPAGKDPEASAQV
jgi:hypothetical protein